LGQIFPTKDDFCEDLKIEGQEGDFPVFILTNSLNCTLKKKTMIAEQGGAELLII
jgi:hypothetical protein